MVTPTPASTTDILQKYCRDLLAADIGPEPLPLPQREEVLKRLFRELADRRSVILIGAPGVGKTSLIHQAIHRVRKQNVPDELREFKFYESSCTNMMADTKYIGEWDTKVFGLVRALGDRSILVLSDMWNLIGAGSYEGSSRDMFDALQSQLQRGEVILIGEMTDQRFEACKYRSPTFAQAFTHIRIEEPPEEAVKTVLHHKAKHLAQHYKLDYGPEPIERAYSVCRRLIPYEVFPGKGVRLLQKVFSETSTVEERHSVDPGMVWQIFARESGLPLFMLDLDMQMDIEEARSFMREHVVGQEEAIEKVVDTFALFKAQLNDPTKPLGTFFFVGPTGVGKTEMAKAMATYLFGSPDRLIRIDMSEFSSPHSVERLLGGGHRSNTLDSHGVLLRKVREQPFSVVLLDEFEKSHALVHDLMLQLMSDGRLTDGAGETADFRNALVIMTSNVGSGRIQSSDIGFSGPASSTQLDGLKSRIRREMETVFRPEFINRLDHIVVFSPLEKDTMMQIARREIQAISRLEGIRDLEPCLEVEDEVLELLVRRGFDPRFGARPLKRAVRELIVTPIARAMVSGPRRRHQIVVVTAIDEQVQLEIVPDEDVDQVEEIPVLTEDQTPSRMTVNEVASSIESILVRIDKAEKTFGIDAAQIELERLEQLRQRPETWTDPSIGDKIEHQYHRLNSDLQRFKRAREIARVVLEQAELGMRKRNSDLLREIAADYERLLPMVQRIEQEADLFDHRDRRDCLLTITSAGVGIPDPEWLKELLAMYEGWTKSKAYGFMRLGEPPRSNAPDPAASYLALVEGGYAYGYLKGEMGLHRLLHRGRGHKGRKETLTTTARVQVQPLLGTSERAASPPAKSEFTVTVIQRLRGEGGAMGHRVSVPGGESELLLVNSESPAVNREVGARILRSRFLLKPETPDRKTLVRVYDRAEHHVVKDRRTGAASHKIEKVMGGQIDPFLVSYLSRERAG